MKIIALVLVGFLFGSFSAYSSNQALVCNSEIITQMEQEYLCVREAARAAAGVAIADYGELSERSCVELTQIFPLANQAFIISTNDPLHYLVQVEKKGSVCQVVYLRRYK